LEEVEQDGAVCILVKVIECHIAITTANIVKMRNKHFTKSHGVRYVDDDGHLVAAVGACLRPAFSHGPRCSPMVKSVIP
jgi:lipoate-protein ligase B